MYARPHLLFAEDQTMTKPKPRHLLTKRPYGETAARVVAAFDADPSLNSVEIGGRLGLYPAYVRKALSRNNRKLKRKEPCNRHV